MYKIDKLEIRNFKFFDEVKEAIANIKKLRDKI